MIIIKDRILYEAQNKASRSCKIATIVTVFRNVRTSMALISDLSMPIISGILSKKK